MYAIFLSCYKGVPKVVSLEWVLSIDFLVLFPTNDQFSFFLSFKLLLELYVSYDIEQYFLQPKVSV